MKFDFTKIAEKYPKSFEKLKEWIKSNEIDSPLQLSKEGVLNAWYKDIFHRSHVYIFNPLELTAFFDGQGIYQTMVARQKSPGLNPPFVFECIIRQEDAMNIYCDKPFSTRELALAECWNKCFEVLEEKL